MVENNGRKKLPGMTIAAFARLVDLDRATVWRCVEDGRITRGVGRVNDRYRILDPAAAREDYERNAEPLAGVRRSKPVEVRPFAGISEVHTEAELRREERGLVDAFEGELLLDEEAGGQEGGAIDYTRERARKVKVEREKAELQLAELRGSVVRVSTVTKVVTEALGAIRSRILALPDRLSVELAERDATAIRLRLRDELREILASSSESLAALGVQT